MSRSRHQRHPTAHNPKKRFPDPDRHRKHKPYGLRGWCGWGGETYFTSRGEVMIDLTFSKKKLRNQKIEIEENE